MVPINIKGSNLLVSKVILAITLVLSAAPVAADNLNVFACEPEWAALAQEIGGKRLKNVFTATHAKQDPHFIRARPSLIAKARRADLLICSGAGLEVGWLPILLQKGSSKIQPGKEGFFMASDFVPVLEIPDVLDRSLGDIHPEGNPHVHLNPHNISIIAEELAHRLIRIDRGNKSYYQAQLDFFLLKWNAAIDRWEQELGNFKNQAIIFHHKSFNYLIDWLKMKPIGAIEPKPGLPPTTNHLKDLLTVIRNQPSTIITISSYDSDTGARWLEEKSGRPVLVLPYTVGGDDRSGDLFSLFDRILQLLKEQIDHG